MKKVNKYTVPTEAQEQKALFEWAEWAKRKYPELDLMYHVVNEGRRSLRYGNELKKQGMKKGVPDICLPVPAHHYIGLYIELKRRDRSLSRVTEEQRGWLVALNRVGHYAVVCYGWEEARNVILQYLRK